jgi:hypothetical protein
MNLSSFFQLNLRDTVNGFLIAFLTAFLSAVVSTLNTGVIPSLGDVKGFAIVGVTAGVSYLAKNLFSNNQGELLKKDA